MSVESALASAIETIPDCTAAGYIDMETGMLLGSVSSEPDQGNTLETLALAAANLFQGRGVKAFEQLLKDAGQDSADHPGFGEIAVFSNDRLHIFLRTQEFPDHVICYICKDSASIGLALTKSHLSLPGVTAAV